MPVIRTKENHVVAYEVGDEDMFCQVMWLGPSELHGLPHAKQFKGPVEPIANHQTAVDWALEMADQMRFPIHVVPLRARDVFKPAAVLRALPHLDDQERGRLRAVVVRAMAEVMRDCDDQAVRADAYQVLEQMKVVEP